MIWFRNNYVPYSNEFVVYYGNYVAYVFKKLATSLAVVFCSFTKDRIGAFWVRR